MERLTRELILNGFCTSRRLQVSRRWDSCRNLFEETVKQCLDTIRRLHESNSKGAVVFTDDPGITSTKASFEKILDHIPPQLIPWICYEIAVHLCSEETNNWEEAALICDKAMKKYPENVIIPMLLSNIFAARDDYYNAIIIKDLRFRRKINLRDTESNFIHMLFRRKQIF